MARPLLRRALCSGARAFCPFFNRDSQINLPRGMAGDLVHPVDVPKCSAYSSHIWGGGSFWDLLQISFATKCFRPMAKSIPVEPFRSQRVGVSSYPWRRRLFLITLSIICPGGLPARLFRPRESLTPWRQSCVRRLMLIRGSTAWPGRSRKRTTAALPVQT